ncbi:GmrSD restriction endonuclease domain-containing protein [Peribacillus frigoritolerans]|uniref:GmrSD restriction endonuclease domain-containing protein n=1 Tax=Peribacillus frigoritolerans TaxID=450367 RepID=UPI003D29AD0A
MKSLEIIGKELGARASEYSMFVNRIGNLTLFGSVLNITASNYPFLENKKNMSNLSSC